MGKKTIILLTALASIFVTATAFVAVDAVKAATTYNAYANGAISSVEFEGNTCRVTIHNSNTATDDVSVVVTTTNQNLLALMRKYEKPVVNAANSTKLTNGDIRAIIRQLPKGIDVDAADAAKLLDEYGMVK
jgi:copper(I)-binding protein